MFNILTFFKKLIKMNLNLKSGDVVTKIPQKANFEIKGYTVCQVQCDNREPQLLYKPIYARIYQLDEIYWTGREFVYLINDDGDVYTIKGETSNVAGVKLERASFADFNKFFDVLLENGYTIHNHKLVERPKKYFYPIYTFDYGFIPSQGTVGDNLYEKYKSWDEAFETKNDCINWCNYLNEKLSRNYPEQEREKA
jgi:hypothetical protein